ncbi:50S ribosomal protein L25 [gamma proteobacterium HdN1]|nr:50S ribosomal protein L25 [gamma proteobacterium HdN1]
MADSFVLNASLRTDLGKGASRRLRRAGTEIPAIIYGGDAAPATITVVYKELVKALENEAFYSHVLTLNLDGNAVQVVLKDLQRHPARNTPTHADFMRVDATRKIQMVVPLHFVNEDKCVGVKTQGGAISHQLSEVLISCLAKDLPEFLEVDVAGLALGHAIHLADIKLPAGVNIVELSLGADHNLPVVSVYLPRGSAAGEEAAAAE